MTIATFAVPDAGTAAPAVNFDGSTNYLRRGANLTGIADSSTGVISCWFKRADTGAQQWFFYGYDSSGGEFVRLGISALDAVICRIDGGSPTIQMTSATLITDTDWHHICVNWDVNAAAGARTFNMYLDDSSDGSATTDSGSAFSNNLDSFTEWTSGTTAATLGSQKFNGCLAEIYYTTEDFNISTTANRRKLISASGVPVSLGSDGSLVTGTAPLVYFTGPATNWGTNSGSDGDFTKNGTFSDCATNAKL